MLTKSIFVATLIWAIYSYWIDSRPVIVDTDIPTIFPLSSLGELSINKQPVQKKINSKGKVFQYSEFKITPLAEFQLAAKVLSSKHYSRGLESNLSPVDLALGWGPMSKTDVIDKFSIKQSNRFYFWRTKNYPIPHDAVISNSANMHFIPSNAMIDKKLKSVKAGQSVRFKGYLVRIDMDSGWRWISSLSRNDSGNGACELILVEEFSIL